MTCPNVQMKFAVFDVLVDATDLPESSVNVNKYMRKFMQIFVCVCVCVCDYVFIY